MNSFHARAGRSRPLPKEQTTPAGLAGVRADALLVTQGIAASRSVARRLIEAGRVVWLAADGLPHAVTQPALALPANTPLRLLDASHMAILEKS